MNTKLTLVIFALLMLAIVFVPIIPDEEPYTCKQVPDGAGSTREECSDSTGYVSVYHKYLSQ